MNLSSRIPAAVEIAKPKKERRRSPRRKEEEERLLNPKLRSQLPSSKPENLSIDKEKQAVYRETIGLEKKAVVETSCR